MVRRNRLTVVQKSKQGIFFQEVFNRHVGRPIIIVGKRQDEFLQLPAVKVYADFHCVTRWSRLDNVWTGVSTWDIAQRADVKPEAKFVLALAYDYGWTTNVPLEYFLKEDSLFAFMHDGAPIPPEHGGPVRLIIPQLYAWKSAKWVKGVRFLAEDQAGFWEEGGYHMRGNPWASGDGERFRWS